MPIDGGVDIQMGAIVVAVITIGAVVVDGASVTIIDDGMIDEDGRGTVGGVRVGSTSGV